MAKESDRNYPQTPTKRIKRNQNTTVEPNALQVPSQQQPGFQRSPLRVNRWQSIGTPQRVPQRGRMGLNHEENQLLLPMMPDQTRSPLMMRMITDFGNVITTALANNVTDLVNPRQTLSLQASPSISRPSCSDSRCDENPNEYSPHTESSNQQTGQRIDAVNQQAQSRQRQRVPHSLSPQVNRTSIHPIPHTTGRLTNQQSNHTAAHQIAVPASAPSRTTSKQGCCTCPKNRCSKGYCSCWSRGSACSAGCDCVSCQNTVDKYMTAARTGNQSPKGTVQRLPNLNDHCNCKRSQCAKRYCVCYAEGRPCNDRCRCFSCKNTDQRDHNHNHGFNCQDGNDKSDKQPTARRLNFQINVQK